MNERLGDGTAWCKRTTEEFGLAPREQEVLVRLVDGRTEHEVAGELGISPHTVHAHVRRLYLKLGVHSRAELLRQVLLYGGQ